MDAGGGPPHCAERNHQAGGLPVQPGGGPRFGKKVVGLVDATIEGWVAGLVEPLRKELKPFPDSEKLVKDSMERLQSRHPERYTDQVNEFEAKVHTMFGHHVVEE